MSKQPFNKHEQCSDCGEGHLAGCAKHESNPANKEHAEAVAQWRALPSVVRDAVIKELQMLYLVPSDDYKAYALAMRILKGIQ